MQRAPFFGITVLFSCLVFGCEARPSNAIANTDTSAGENDWATSRSATPRGEIKALKIRDDVYNRDRNIWVYTPPGYDAAASTPYHLAVFLDGMSYATEEIPAGIIFDNLLAARRIQPTVALMVDTSESRMDDLANHQRFADSIAGTLIPFARKNWKVTTEASQTIVCGYSAGGLAASYLAFKHPEIFGNVLSQSGAYWRDNEGGSDGTEWLTSSFRNSSRLPVRFYLEVGALETGRTAGGPVFIEANQRFRDVLQSKGYDVKYIEIPNARHEPAHWKSTLGDGLIWLLSK